LDQTNNGFRRQSYAENGGLVFGRVAANEDPGKKFSENFTLEGYKLGRCVGKGNAVSNRKEDFEHKEMKGP